MFLTKFVKKHKFFPLAVLFLLCSYCFSFAGDVVVDFDSCPEYWSWNNKPTPNSFTWQNFEFVNLNCNIGYGYPGTAGRALGCNNTYGDYYWINSKIGAVIIKGMQLRSWLGNTGNCKDRIIFTGYKSGQQVATVTISKTSYLSYNYLTLNWLVDQIKIVGDSSSDGNNGVSLDIDNLTYAGNKSPVITEGGSVSVTMDEDGSPTAFSKTLHATDGDNDPLTWSIKTNPGHGAASVNGSGVVSYTPATNYNNTDSFAVRVADPYAGEAVCTVNVTINAQPDKPVAVNDTVSTNEDTPVTINVLANDTDPDGSAPVLLSVGTPAHGTAAVTAGKILYTPATNYNGTDSFQYTIQDSANVGWQLVGIVNVTVNPVNDAPTNISLSANNIAENQPAGTLIGNLSTDDSDAGDTFTYSLVSSTDANAFRIEGSKLLSNAVLDFEAKSSYTFNIMTADKAGLTFSKSFTITVINANDVPTDIQISANTIAENLPPDTVIGILSSTDQDASDTFIYSLVPGDGANDNVDFKISGNQLKSKKTYDYETKKVYVVCVQTDDGKSGRYHKNLTITIQDANDSPSDIVLSNNTVTEGMPIGTAVGSLQAIDPDAGDTFTFSLVAGSGSENNASFTIDGAQLKTSAVFNIDNGDYYNIRVQVLDKAGKKYQKSFGIEIIEVKETPSDITLSANSIAENQPAGTLIGKLSTLVSGSATSSTFTYTLTAGDGSTDNASFAIDGDQLKSSAAFDFETKQVYQIRIKTTRRTDSFEKTFTVVVSNVNEPPTAIVLSNASVSENQPAGTVVGTLAAADPDAGDSIAFALANGAGDADNGAFTVSGNQLATNATFDYETKKAYSVRVKVTDSQGLTYESAFAITVTDANEAPLTLTLSNTTVTENLEPGTIVGQFDTTDPDQGNTFSYSLISGEGGAGNGSFAIENNQLKTAAKLDYESQNTYSILVQSTDQGGLFISKSFIITVLNGKRCTIGYYIK